MYIDSHCHLFDKAYEIDLADVISRARDAGVEVLVVPGTNLVTSMQAVEIAHKHHGVYACVGCHPHDANGFTDEHLKELEALTFQNKVVAVGEIGLDFFYDFAPKEIQKRVFEIQIDLAIARDLPIVVHTRDSMVEALTTVEQYATNNLRWRSKSNSAHSIDAPMRGVFHCFTGGTSDAQKLFELGFLVSYPGIVTFKNSPVGQTLKEIHLNHIMLETDSPYMTPIPHRGKRNEPANIVHIGKAIAAICGVSIDQVARVTTQNARSLFDLSVLPENK
jgi:TatD DNase family protein